MRRLLLLLPETSIDELVTNGTCLNGKSHGYYVYDNEEVGVELINKVREACNMDKAGTLFELRISNVEDTVDIRNIVAVYRLHEDNQVTLICNLKGDSIFS